MARVVLTGASGHIGGHVARLLVEHGHEVVALVRSVSPRMEEMALSGVGVRKISFGDLAETARHVESADAVFHLAAKNTTRNEPGIDASTCGLTEHMITAAKTAGTGPFIYTSSVVVIGRSRSPGHLLDESGIERRGSSPYVQGKIAAETIAREAGNSGLDVRIVYPSWVMGPGDPGCTPPHRLVRNFLRRGQPFSFAGGVSIADVVSVAAAHVAVWQKGSAGDRYILGGENITFQQLYAILADASGRTPPVFQVPKALLVAAAIVPAVWERVSGAPCEISPSYVNSVVGRYSWYDSARARDVLGYCPLPAEEILRSAVRDARQYFAGTQKLNSRLKSAAPAAGKGRILITGVPGWLGNRMLEILAGGSGTGADCRRPLRLLVHPKHRDLLDLPEGIEAVYGDLSDPRALRDAVRGVETVFHLAGTIYPRRIRDLYNTNFQGSRNLADACVKEGVRRILFMSTDSVCGYGRKGRRVFDETTPDTPYSDYGQSKWQAEQYLFDKTKSGHLDATVLRGFWFFGPYAPARQLNFLRMFNWPRQIVFGNGRNLRSISHVDDIIRAFLLAEKEPKTIGKWYWIGDPDGGYPADQIYREIAGALNVSYRPVHVPRFICELLRIADRMLACAGFLHPTLHAAAKFHRDIAGRSDAASRDFGYRPVMALSDAAKEIASDKR